MKYQHIVIYTIKGLTPQSGENDTEIAFDSKSGFRAILTTNPEIYTFHGDQANAIGGLMLNSFWGSGNSKKLKEQLKSKVAEIQETRRQKFGDGLYLVCLTEGKASDFNQSLKRERDDFVVCINGVREPLNIASKQNIMAILSSLFLSGNRISSLNEAGNFLVFFQEDGKPVYSLVFSASMQSTISQPLTKDILNSIEEWYQLLVADQDLNRVGRLAISSLKIEDKLRSFLSAWNALEIFVNKTFKGVHPTFVRLILRIAH
jgi:hypothetical protein